MIDNSNTEPLDSLKPQELKSRLLANSIILSSYEIIKSMVVPRTKLLFLIGFGYGGNKYSDDYENDVLTRHKSLLIASAKYLAEHYEAISLDDVDQIVKLRDMRNRIAHELPTVLIKEEFSKVIEYVQKARELVLNSIIFGCISIFAMIQNIAVLTGIRPIVIQRCLSTI